MVLTVSGLYNHSRKLIYLKALLSPAGWVFVLGGLTGVIVVASFVAIMMQLQVLPEERVLLKSFGKSLLIYKNKVRRWL